MLFLFVGNSDDRMLATAAHRRLVARSNSLRLEARSADQSLHGFAL